jgi:hypothetical protein
METVLTRRRLNRALLERQHLLRRATLPVADAVEHLVGLQCQEPPAPYVGLWSRLEAFDPQELSAMVADRRAVRLGLFRWTQHLVTARDAPWLRGQVQTLIEKRMWSSLRRYLDGVDLGELEAAARALLADGPKLAAELGRALQPRWPHADAQWLGIAAVGLVPVVQLPPRSSCRPAACGAAPGGRC